MKYSLGRMNDRWMTIAWSLKLPFEIHFAHIRKRILTGQWMVPLTDTTSLDIFLAILANQKNVDSCGKTLDRIVSRALWFSCANSVCTVFQLAAALKRVAFQIKFSEEICRKQVYIINSLSLMDI